MANRENISSDGLCAETRLANNSYTHYNGTNFSQLPEIINSIHKLEIDPNIKSSACLIYENLLKTRLDCRTKFVKGKHKLILLFYCIYMGFIKNGSTVDPYYVAELVSLPSNLVNKALNSYSDPGCTLYVPEDGLSFYVQNINKHLSKHGITFDNKIFLRDTIEILRICRLTKEGNTWVNETSVRLVCLSTIFFYLIDMKGFSIERYEKDFEKALYTTKTSIKKHYQALIKYYNKSENTISSTSILTNSMNSSQDDDDNDIPQIKRTFSALHMFDSDSESESSY